MLVKSYQLDPITEALHRRGIGFPRIGVWGGDSGAGDAPNGLPPGIRAEKPPVLMLPQVAVTQRSHHQVTLNARFGFSKMQT